MNTPHRPDTTEPVEKPWWQYGMVWLVIGGSAAVVVAGVVTTVIALRGADPVIVAAPSAASANGSGDALVPALQARNRAAGASQADKP